MVSIGSGAEERKTSGEERVVRGGDVLDVWGQVG